MIKLHLIHCVSLTISLLWESISAKLFRSPTPLALYNFFSILILQQFSRFLKFLFNLFNDQ